VLPCLAAKREALAPRCAALLFDAEVALAESVDFNWPLKRACARELQRFCKGVPRAHGRAIR
jgi:Golgi apparatus protein 1